jgi:preprotein translocase subunit SecG
MYTLISILIIITCILLILIVLVQNSKGGGLASNFSASNQVMGVRKTNDFLEKSTWTLAIVLLALCLFSSMTIQRGVETEVKGSAIQNQIDDAPAPVQEQPVTPPPAESTPAQ